MATEEIDMACINLLMTMYPHKPMCSTCHHYLARFETLVQMLAGKYHAPAWSIGGLW